MKKIEKLIDSKKLTTEEKIRALESERARLYRKRDRDFDKITAIDGAQRVIMREASATSDKESAEVGWRVSGVDDPAPAYDQVTKAEMDAKTEQPTGGTPIVAWPLPGSVPHDYKEPHRRDQIADFLGEPEVTS